MSKRKWLDSEKKNIIISVYELLHDIQFNKINLFDSSESDLIQLVAQTAFVSKSTVDKVLRERITSSSVEVMDATNNKIEPQPESNNQPAVNLDATEPTPQIDKRKGRPMKSFTKEQENILREIIYDFHKTENCHVTLKRLLIKVTSELDFDGGYKTL